MTIHEHQRLIWFRTADDFLISALLVTKEHVGKDEVLDTPILLQIHGLLGNFLSRGTPRLLPHALLEHGFSSMSINTRLAFAGQINGMGIFDDTLKDIDAAVDVLAREGFRNIFILGYSLGASMLAYWASKRDHPNVRGLIFEGLHYSLPDTKKRLFRKWKSMPAYEELYERAKSVLGDNPYNSPDDETFVVYRCTGPTMEPMHDEIYTCKTWWFMIGPEAHCAMAHKHIGKVKLPFLIMRGEGDFLVDEWEPGALARIAREAGNEGVWVRQIAGARHECMENAPEMLKEISGMLLTYAKG